MNLVGVTPPAPAPRPDSSPEPDRASPSPGHGSLRLVVMGVAGAGKTLIGRGLARRLGGEFVDADDLHPAANVTKMRAGQPLTDDDRWPWLDLCGRRLADAATGRRTLVLACSALRRAYRDRLRHAMPTADRRLCVVYLNLDPATAADRVGGRSGHYMPASLIDSQFATLEPPDPAAEPDVIVVDARLDPATIMGRVRQALVGA